MNRILFPIKVFSIILLISAAFFTVFAQPELEQKKIQAKSAFDEAIRLREERNFKSYKSALEKFQEAAALYAELGSPANQGRALLGVGLMKNLLGENDEALRIYLQVLEIFRAVGDKTLEARTLNNLGTLYDELDDKPKALEYHKLALPLRRSVGDKSGEAQTLNSLGVVYMNLGERQKALDSFNRALKIRRATGERREQAVVLNNLGRLFDDLGNKPKAFEYFNAALDLRRQTGDKGGEAITLNNLGMALADENPRKAIEYYQKSLAIFSELGFETPQATVINNLGAAYLEIDEPRKALEINAQALSIYRKSGSKSGAATALNNIGFAQIELGMTAQGLGNFHEALILARNARAVGLEAVILGNLMKTYASNANASAAIFYGKHTVNTYQKLRGAIKDLDRSTRLIYLQSIEDQYRFLADLLIESGRFEQAKQVLEMLKEEEFAEFVRRDADEIRSLARRVALNEKEKLLLERYAALADRATRTGADFQKLDEKKLLLEQRGETLSTSEDAEYKKLSAELADANAAFKIFLEKELIKEIGSGNLRKIELDRNLQERLRRFGRDVVIISTVVTDERYRVILTTPTLQIDGKTDVKTAELNRKIFDFRQALQDSSIDPRPLGKELYDILVKPIEKPLQESGAQTLVWSLDGVLRYIPLAALSPDGETYLIEKYRTAVLTPQTRDDLDEIKSDWKMLGMGVSTAQKVFYPDFPDEPVELEPLPAVEDELKMLVREDRPDEKGILAGRRFLNDDFTLKNLTEFLTKTDSTGRKEFNAVHLASHFRLAPNWADSFLLLGGGRILTLEQIGNASQIDFKNVELVTLSACNTASDIESDGGEIDGLASLIQTKNGKSVLATLWEVEDRSTALLMNNFYRLRQENPNLTKAEALQKAQKFLLYGGEKPRPNAAVSQTKNFRRDLARPFAHPVYWSPFVLFGNWR